MDFIILKANNESITKEEKKILNARQATKDGKDILKIIIQSMIGRRGYACLIFDTRPRLTNSFC